MENEYELKYSKFFHSYTESFKPFWESGKLVELQENLKKEKLKGQLLPENNIFRCFKETSIDNLKVIFTGLSPYFTPGIPDSLAFSCSRTMKEQPSLRVLLDACEQDLGYKDDRNPDLSRWASQGVLLLNASLTTLPNEARVHLPIWKDFMEFFFKKVIKEKELVIVFFGKDSQEFVQFTNSKFHYPIAVNHPSYFARNNTSMQTSLFSDANKTLKRWGKSPINWQEYGSLPFKETEEVKYKEFI